MTQPNLSGGPPSNIDAADLWTKLTTLPRPYTEVAFPRRHPVTKEMFTDKVAIRVLTEAELMKARAASDAYAKDLLGHKKARDAANESHNADVTGGLAYPEIYRNACIVEVLWLACRSVVNLPNSLGTPAFPSTQMMRQYLTSDEFAVLFHAYSAFQMESGPILSSMTKEEMDAWIDVLREGASRLPLARLSSEALKDLILHMVSRLSTSPTDNGSPGSPPGSSSPTNDRQSSDLASLRNRRANTSTDSSVDPSERPEPLERDE